MEKEKKDQLNTISDYSFKLSTCEVGLGSILHAFHVPFSGHALSMNQIFFLTLATKEFKNSSYRGRVAFYISQISALLKSLSPAGKKLGPMISISMQGLLFTAPQYIFPNALSVLIGAALASIWAFIQPLVTLYILFGSNLIGAYEFYIEKIQKTFQTNESSLLVILSIPVLTKIALSVGIAGWTYFNKSNESAKKITDYLVKKSQGKKRTRRKPSIIKDLTRPLFLLSLVLTASYLYLNRELLSPTIWSYLRPFAVCIILMRINRTQFIKKLIEGKQDKVFFQILKSVNLKLEKHLN